MEDTLLESIQYILTAVITGLVAYYMFNEFVKQQITSKKLELLSERKKRFATYKTAIL